MDKAVKILDVKVNLLDISLVVEVIDKWLIARGPGVARYICLTNVNSVVEAQKNPCLKKITNESDLSVCDGMPLVWLARAKGFKLKQRVYGYALMKKLFDVSGKNNFGHYFYGSTDAVLKKMLENIKKAYPNLKVSGSYSPPFRQLEESEKDSVIKDINTSKADIIWVGLGYPKQEIWMYEFRKLIKCPVLIGVGAAFDFFSGNKGQAPLWMQNAGLEWLFRLLLEPKRLWRRYLINNTLFIFFLLKEAFFLKSPLRVSYFSRQKEV